MSDVTVGTIVHVRDFKSDSWSEAYFIAFDRDHDYPYICGSIDGELDLTVFEATRWMYCKELEP